MLVVTAMFFSVGIDTKFAERVDGLNKAVNYKWFWVAKKFFEFT